MTRQPVKTMELVVFITVPSVKEGKRIGRHLVNRRLAACVNVIPRITSWFRWKGKSVEAREALLIVKTQARLFRVLEQAVKDQHPYTVPEVIALPIVKGSQEYLAWVRDETT